MTNFTRPLSGINRRLVAFVFSRRRVFAYKSLECSGSWLRDRYLGHVCLVTLLQISILIGASEFADMHPSADVLGVDLSPIQPNFVPPNCRFEVDDINQDWTYPENKFDFVHLRGLTGCIPDWTKFYEGAIKFVLPHQ